jgi:Flp pilus assembly protein TadD
MCQKQPSLTATEKLEAIAAIDPQHYIAYVCLGVALWIRGYFDQALTELKLAVPLNREEWDAYFWQGIVCASLGQDEEAIASIEQSLQLDLPPLLLAPLHWFEQDKPDFYEQYAIPLLTRYDV